MRIHGGLPGPTLNAQRPIPKSEAQQSAVRNQESTEPSSLTVGNDQRGERAGDPGGWFGVGGEVKIDLAAVGAIPREGPSPSTVVDHPTVQSGRSGIWHAGDKASVSSGRRAQVDEFKVLIRREGKRAEATYGEGRMRERRSKRQLDDGSGTHGNGTGHSQRLSGRSSAPLQNRTARRY